MSLFNRVIGQIESNKKLRDDGKYVGIPYPFSRLRRYIPVIEKGHSIGILAGTGVGKSRFTRYLFIYHCVKFAIDNNYPLQIYYFPLEDNKEKVYANIMCHYLKEIHKISISVQRLMSKDDNPLPYRIIDALKSSESFFSSLESYVKIIDELSHPKDIYDYLELEAQRHGKIETEMNREGKILFKSYSPYDDVHRMVIIDNLYNFDSNKGENERDLMIEFCRKYVRAYLCNRFNFTVVQVMQMSFDKERQQFTNSGMSIMSKLEPSLDGIGEAKVIARSMHLIFGIFNPDRYEILSYPNSNGYNIGILQNRFRALKVLKCNDSDVGMRIGLLFDALSESFTELPLPEDKDQMERVYSYIKSLREGNISRELFE